ncbi:MAG: M56 family metallopeptidase, partial [Planctomycetota bacterium]
MSGQALFDPSFSGRLCITLVHSLWQVALCAAVAWVLGLIWRRSVERSYAAHVAALLAGLVALPITYALVGGEGRIPVSRIEPLADSPSQAPLSLSAGYGGPQLPIETSERAARPPTTTPTSALISPAGATSSSTTPASPSTLWLQAAPWIAALYAAGVLVMLARLLRGVWHAHRLASAAQVIAEGVLAERLRSLAGRWSMRLVPALAQSGEIAVPRLVGLLKPMILLPVSAIAGLSTDELELILAHELAHVRRHDMWVNLAQRAAEVLLFFNPGLWYLSRRISTLREYCCDELTCRAAVGADAGRRMCYATALLRIVELSLQGEHHRRCGRVLKGDELAALAAAGRSPSELRRRVAHLFGEPLREPLRLTRSGVITLAALVALLLVAPATRHTAAVSAPATGVGGTEATGSRQTPASTERASPPAATKPATTTQEIDPAEVRRKIAALALPDETAPYEEQAIHWLRRRAAQVAPQLIAGLNNANPQVAAQCLNLLREVPPSKDLTDALVAKASDANSPLRYEALRVLEKSAADPRVARLLDQASSEAPTSDETQARGESQRSSSEAESFPNAVTRARWASLAGRNDRAVELLRPLLDKSESVRWETVEGIRLLGEVDAPAGIALLEPIAAGDNWGLAIEAYQALAKIDPENHGLTEDQATLLRNWRSFKETREHFEKRTSELARLSAKEVRPLVLQMLGDTEHQGQRAALSILTAWKDKEALPEIRRLMRAERSYQREAAVLAYLSIDESQQAEQEVLTLLEQRDEFARDAVLRGVCRAGIPAARKLAILRAARTRLTEPHSLPSALRSIEEDEVLPVLLVPLMDEETSLRALAGYCGIAAADKDRRFAPQVRRALKLVASEPSIAAGGENTDAGTAEAGTAILAAAAVYNLRELATEIEGLLDSANPEIRLTAQAAGAKLGIERALTGLYHRLHAEVPYVRKQAANAILWSLPVDEKKRAAREAAVLS